VTPPASGRLRGGWDFTRSAQGRLAIGVVLLELAAAVQTFMTSTLLPVIVTGLHAQRQLGCWWRVRASACSSGCRRQARREAARAELEQARERREAAARAEQDRIDALWRDHPDIGGLTEYLRFIHLRRGQLERDRAEAHADFEEVKQDVDALAADQRFIAPKGEIVIVVGPGAAHAASPEEADAALLDALTRAGPAEAAAEVAKALGLPRRDLYARVLALRSR